MKNKFKLVLMLMLTLTFAIACGEDADNKATDNTTPAADNADKTPAAELKSIYDTAKAAGGFDTLIAAVDAAGLADVLKGDGTYTVFAPTDEAFAQIPKAVLDSLLTFELRSRI